MSGGLHWAAAGAVAPADAGPSTTPLKINMAAATTSTIAVENQRCRDPARAKRVTMSLPSSTRHSPGGTSLTRWAWSALSNSLETTHPPSAAVLRGGPDEHTPAAEDMQVNSRITWGEIHPPSCYGLAPWGPGAF